jgi:hypothetical protein
MNGVTVPRGFNHMLAKKRTSVEDHKATLRHYIEARPNVPLTTKDFDGALGVSSGMSHVRTLMKRGYITRNRIKAGRGKRFSYKWHTEPLAHDKAARANGQVITRQLAMPDYPLSTEDMDKMAPLMVEWFDKTQPSAEQMSGVLIFRQWLDKQFKEVEQRRREVLNAHNDNSNNNSGSGISRTTETQEG